MKIVFLSRYQNNINRGAETVVRELSDHLSKFHDVEILSGKDADSISKILSGNYDIVIAINGGFQSLKASVGRLFKNYKLIITSQSGIGRSEIWNIVIAKPDIFVATTDKIYRWAKKWARGSKVIKISTGVDLQKFNPTNKPFKHSLKKPVILSVGALTWYKHHEKTIEALSLLDDVSLLIVGKGPEKEKLIQLGNQKIPGRFKIIEIQYDQMPNIYTGVDLFVLPSWDREAFGIVYLEAMASNVAVVGPDDDSRREIIGTGGILTDVNNPRKFADAIKIGLYKNWDNLPRKQAEKFSWDTIIKEYLKIL